MTDRTRTLVFASLLLAALAALAVPASAQVYTVTLHNGTTFESRYAPRESDWDPNMVLVMTEMGNTIGIHRDEVVGAVSEIEAQGFGRPIDAVTVDLGWAANDLPVPDADADPNLQRFRDIEDLVASSRDARRTDTEQFVSPGRAGQTGGLPLANGEGPTVIPFSIGTPVN
jgi:hypothetical protein